MLDQQKVDNTEQQQSKRLYIQCRPDVSREAVPRMLVTCQPHNYVVLQ